MKHPGILGSPGCKGNLYWKMRGHYLDPSNKGPMIEGNKSPCFGEISEATKRNIIGLIWVGLSSMNYLYMHGVSNLLGPCYT